MQNGKQRKFLVPHSYLLCIMLKLDHMAFYFFDTLCSTSYYKLSSLRIAIMWSEEEENAKKFKFYRELETISFLQFFLACLLACFCLRSIREKVITFSELCEGHRHYWLDAVNFEEGKDLNYVLVMTFFSTFIIARKIIIIIVVEWLWSCPCLIRNIQFLSLSPHGSFFKVNVKLSLLHALFGMHIAMHIHGKLIDWCRLIVINVNLSFLVNQFPRVCLSGLLPCYKHMPFVCVCCLMLQ